MTPYAQKFRGVAKGHARSRYAGGSWRSSWSVGLSVPVRRWRFDSEPCAASKGHHARSRCRQDANHNGHIPTTRAARLPDVLVQSAVVIIDGVPVSSAVGMHVSDLVMMMLLLMKMTASKAVMIEARFSGRSFRGCNESGLKRECNHGRHHDGGRQSSAE